MPWRRPLPDPRNDGYHYDDDLEVNDDEIPQDRAAHVSARRPPPLEAKTSRASPASCAGEARRLRLWRRLGPPRKRHEVSFRARQLTFGSAACVDIHRLFCYARMMQRNPRWEVEVSTACGMRAAGR